MRTLSVMKRIVQALESTEPEQLSKQDEVVQRNMQAFKIIVESNNNDNANNYFVIEKGAKLANRPFPDGLAVIDYMKERGLWK